MAATLNAAACWVPGWPGGPAPGRGIHAPGPAGLEEITGMAVPSVAAFHAGCGGLIVPAQFHGPACPAGSHDTCLGASCLGCGALAVTGPAELQADARILVPHQLTRPCLAVTCDSGGCPGMLAEPVTSRPACFPSLAAAVKAAGARGWLATGEGTAYCPRCRASRAARPAAGHRRHARPDGAPAAARMALAAGPSRSLQPRPADAGRECHAAGKARNEP